MPLPPASKLVLTDPERKQLQAISRHRNTPVGIALRVKILLGAAEGTANHVLARELSTSLPTVLLWRRRYDSDGLAGVIEDRHRSGRPKQLTPEKEAAIVEATIKTTPQGCDSLECSDHGRESEGEPGNRTANLEEAQVATAPGRVFQVQHRPGIRSEGARHRWVVSGPTGTRHRA